MSRGRESLVFERNIARFGAARVASQWKPGSGGSVGPLKLKTRLPELDLPADGWVRIKPHLSGICASDLAAVDGRSSRWFDPIVSMPFVPGHEVVADHDGVRVVVEPVLGCVARGVEPVCAPCARGDLGNCGNLAHGDVSKGLQSGFCCDTGGGWSTSMVAHRSQLHPVPDDLSDEAAVLIEPMACATHAALAAQVQPDELVAVIGAGTMGLGVTAALQRWTPPATLLVAAKHPQQTQLAHSLADCSTVAPAEILRAARRITGSQVLGRGSSARLATGVDVTIDCVGSPASIESAISITKPTGRVILMGMPGKSTIDLTALWQREINLRGAYTYGREVISGRNYRTFDLAAELIAAADLQRMLSAVYPMNRYTEAISHAASAGSRGAVKIAIDPRKGSR